MLNDIRHAIRQLARSPGFTVVALLTLALGIGATTAIFTVVDAVLLRPLEYPQPDRIAVVQETGGDERAVSPPNFLDWEKSSTSFTALTAVRGFSYNLTGGPEPQRLIGARVTGGYFEVFGVAPLLGRAFQRAEDAPGNNRVVVLTDRFWQRQFGAATDVLGHTLQLNGQTYTVIGVMPASFQRGTNVEFWTPMAFGAAELAPNYRGAHYLRVYGRLRPGISGEQAQAELAGVARQLEEKFPDTNKGRSVQIASLQDFTVRDVRRILVVLLGAVGCVLLIACANLANLQLARATTRWREISIRAAVGASRGRIFRQLITESLCLALAGGLFGVLLARWGLDLLLALAPDAIPRAKEITLDGPVLAFSLLISFGTGIFFGLVPAWQATRLNLTNALRASERGQQSGHRGRLRQGLVVVEVALSLVLLVGAGLLARSFLNLNRVNPGFVAANATAVSLTLPEGKYGDPSQQLAFAAQAAEKFRALPGVASVGVTHSLPLVGGESFNFFVKEHAQPAVGQEPATNYFAVSPEYFKAMGIQLLRGRTFTDRDDGQSAPVCLINETFARKHFAGEDPIGKRMQITNGNAAFREIIGIVADVTDGGLDQTVGEQAYDSLAQSPDNHLNFIIRTEGPASPALLQMIRPQIFAVDRDQPVSRIKPLGDIVASTMGRQRFATTLLGVFSVVALVIAAVGIFGVMAYTVSQRTGEIGIRLALGATHGDVLRLVIGQGMTVVSIGIGVGLLAGLAFTQVMQSMLFKVNARDPLTFGLIAAGFAAVALLACLLPALRTLQADPLTALRSE